MQLDMDALPVMLSQAMQRQNLSVRETARKCGVSYGNMSSILYGRSKRPSPELLEALSRGLGIPYQDLALAAYGVLPSSIGHPAALVPA